MSPKQALCLILLAVLALFPSARSASADDPSCSDLFKVKSQGSDTPAKITFINKSGMYRSILWLDFGGRPKDYANLNDGEEMTLDTFLTHPWMVTDGPGNCIEIVMPHPGTRVVTLKAGDDSVEESPASEHGCAPGLAWNAQEGCHEND